MKAVFIDIDNTLLDFDEFVRSTMKKGFAHFGLREYEPWMYKTFKEENDKLWNRIEQGTLTFTELKKIRWNMIFEVMDIKFDGNVFEEYFRKEFYDSAIIIPGAMDMLEALHGKYILCAASNGPYGQQMNRIAVAGMDKYFDYSFISEKIGASKPASEYYDEAFRILNKGRDKKIQPEDTVMVGDSFSSDMTGGSNYGMKTCFYRRDPSKEITEAMSDKIDAVVDSLTDIPEAVRRLFAFTESSQNLLALSIDEC